MRDSTALVERWLVGDDIEAAKEGARVGGDDLAVDLPCDFDGDSALSNGGWAEDHKDLIGLQQLVLPVQEFPEALQLGAARGMLQLLDRLDLDLAHALAGDVELERDILERARVVVVQAVA